MSEQKKSKYPQLDFCDKQIENIKLRSSNIGGNQNDPWIIEVIEITYKDGCYEVFTRDLRKDGPFKYAYGATRGGRDENKR